MNINSNHRYPIRGGGLNIPQSEQLLQKRTRTTQNQSKNDKSNIDYKQQTQQSYHLQYENPTGQGFQNIKKSRKEMTDISAQQQTQVSQFNELNSSNSKMKARMQKALQKTNPRMANAQYDQYQNPSNMNMMNQQQVHQQLFQNPQAQFITKESGLSQQFGNPLASVQNDLIGLNRLGAIPQMTIPNIPAYLNLPMMGIPQVPQINDIHQSGYNVNSAAMVNKIAELQQQLYYTQMMQIQQQIQHAQQYSLNPAQNAFQSHMNMFQQSNVQHHQNQQSPQKQANQYLFQQQMNAIQSTDQLSAEHNEEENDEASQQKTLEKFQKINNKNFKQSNQIQKDKSNVASPKRKESPEYKGVYNSIQQHGNKKATPKCSQGTKNIESAETTGKSKLNEKNSKIAVNNLLQNPINVYAQTGGKNKTTVNFDTFSSEKKTPTKQIYENDSQDQDNNTQTLNKSKNNLKSQKKLQDIYNQNVFDESNVRRTTRNQKNETGNVKKQNSGYTKTTQLPKLKKQKVKAYDQSINNESQSNSRSPNSSSQKAKGIRKNQISPVKSRNQLTNLSKNFDEQLLNVRETRASTRLSTKSTYKAQLQNRDLNIQKKLHEKQKINKTPTKDEILLFGEQSLENPLIQKSKNSKKYVEAQTEIVNHQIINLTSQEKIVDNQQKTTLSENAQIINSDEEEDDRELQQQMEKEKVYIAEQQCQILTEEKLKDMSILFGIPEEEIQEIARIQKAKQQQMKDQSILFGSRIEVNLEQSPAKIMEFNKIQNYRLKNDEQKTGTLNKELQNQIKPQEKLNEEDEIMLFGNVDEQRQKVTDKIEINHMIQKEYKSSASQNKSLQDIQSVTIISKSFSTNQEDSIIYRNQYSSNTENIKLQQPLQQIQVGLMPSSQSKSFDINVQQNNSQSLNEQNPQIQNQQQNHQHIGGKKVPTQNCKASDDEESFDIVLQKTEINIILQEEQENSQENITKQQEDLERQIEEIKKQIEMQEKKQNQKQPDQYKEQDFNNQIQQQKQASETSNDTENEAINFKQPVKSSNVINQNLQVVDVEISGNSNYQKQQTTQQQNIQIQSQQDQKMQDCDKQLQQASAQVNFSQQVPNKTTQYVIDQHMSDDEQSSIIIQKEVQKKNDFGTQVTKINPQLEIPSHFQTLSNFQSLIDQCMNLLHSRQQIASFHSVKNMIEKQCQKQFNMQHFQQILHLVPKFYNYKWEKKFEKIEMMISLPRNIEQLLNGMNNGVELQAETESLAGQISSKIMSGREMLFKQELLKLVRSEFENQRQYNNMLQKYDIFQLKVWPQEFKMQRVPEVKLAELREQPQQNKTKVSVNEFINIHDSKPKYIHILDEPQAKVIEDQATKVQNLQRESQTYEEDCDDSEDSSSDDSEKDSSEEAMQKQSKFEVRTGISQATQDAIQMKQLLQNNARIKNDEILKKQDTQKNVDLLLKIYEQIKLIFSLEQGSTIFLTTLLEQLMQGSIRGIFTSKETLKEQIHLLHKINPHWIQINLHSHGTFVKVHKNLNLQNYQLKTQIQAYFDNLTTFEQQIDDQVKPNQNQFESSIISTQPRENIQNSQNQNTVIHQTPTQQKVVSKSCPPLNGPSSQNQMISPANNSKQNQSAFQPFQNSQRSQNQQLQSNNASSNKIPQVSQVSRGGLSCQNNDQQPIPQQYRQQMLNVTQVNPSSFQTNQFQNSVNQNKNQQAITSQNIIQNTKNIVVGNSASSGTYLSGVSSSHKNDMKTFLSPMKQNPGLYDKNQLMMRNQFQQHQQGQQQAQQQQQQSQKEGIMNSFNMQLGNNLYQGISNGTSSVTDRYSDSLNSQLFMQQQQQQQLMQSQRQQDPNYMIIGSNNTLQYNNNFASVVPPQQDYEQKYNTIQLQNDQRNNISFNATYKLAQ